MIRALAGEIWENSDNYEEQEASKDIARWADHEITRAKEKTRE